MLRLREAHFERHLLVLCMQHMLAKKIPKNAATVIRQSANHAHENEIRRKLVA
jgi:hypothetical protein